MRVFLLFMMVMSLSSREGIAQKNPIKLRETGVINDSFSMKYTEVTIVDYMNFIANNQFDSSLFPECKGMSATANILFEDLKRGSDFKYLELSATPRHLKKLYGEKNIRSKKEIQKLIASDTNYFSLRIPVTGISFAQAVAYCKWKESIVNNESNIKITISLPTVEQYIQVIPNKDSINAEKCYMMNVMNCKCFKKKMTILKTEGKCLQMEDAYWPDNLGLYNIQGNAAEMTSTEGIAMGGSFRHYARQSFNDQRQLYTAPEDWLGFRYVVTRKKDAE